MGESSDHSNEFPRKRRLIRNAKGRFVSSYPLTNKKVKRVQQQRKHKERKRELQNNIFDKYLNAFVLSGNGNDSIHASRSTGPFAQVFEGIVKEDFRLGPNIRHALLKQYYSEGGHLKSVNLSAVKLATKPQKYKGCRLPQVKYGSEMSVVRKWIEMVSGENALLFPTVDTALEFCKEQLRNDATSADISRPALHPLKENNAQDGSLCNNCRSSVSCGQENAASTSEGNGNLKTAPSVIQTAAAATSDTHGSFVEASSPDETLTWPRLSSLTDNSRTDLIRSKRFEVCLEIARNEKMYLLLHLVLDDTLESKFGAYAGQYLKDFKKRGEEPNALVNQLMLYAHWKRFGSPNQCEYERLERHIRNTAAVADRVRILSSTDENPLSLYKDMQWKNRA